MPKIKFTALAVAKITPPKKGQIDYFDVAFPAFGLRVSPAGTKSFFVMTRVHGKLVRLSVGKAKIIEEGPGITLKEAREKAGEYTEMTSRGLDPRQINKQEKQNNEGRARDTFKIVGERFMQQHVKPRLASATQSEYERILFGEDTKLWAHLPVASIARADVRRVLDAIVERGSPKVPASPIRAIAAAVSSNAIFAPLATGATNFMESPIISSEVLELVNVPTKTLLT